MNKHLKIPIEKIIQSLLWWKTHYLHSVCKDVKYSCSQVADIRSSLLSFSTVPLIHTHMIDYLSCYVTELLVGLTGFVSLLCPQAVRGCGTTWRVGRQPGLARWLKSTVLNSFLSSWVKKTMVSHRGHVLLLLCVTFQWCRITVMSFIYYLDEMR